ncbi:unnamed protein product, partial [Ectocarpus sp. 13 AM-2016]
FTVVTVPFECCPNTSVLSSAKNSVYIRGEGVVAGVVVALPQYERFVRDRSECFQSSRYARNTGKCLTERGGGRVSRCVMHTNDQNKFQDTSSAIFHVVCVNVRCRLG